MYSLLWRGHLHNLLYLFIIINAIISLEHTKHFWEQIASLLRWLFQAAYDPMTTALVTRLTGVKHLIIHPTLAPLLSGNLGCRAFANSFYKPPFSASTRNATRTKAAGKTEKQQRKGKEKNNKPQFCKPQTIRTANKGGNDTHFGLASLFVISMLIIFLGTPSLTLPLASSLTELQFSGWAKSVRFWDPQSWQTWGSCLT